MNGPALVNGAPAVRFLIVDQPAVEVQAHLAELYGAEVSRETISRITAPTDGAV